MIAFIKGRLVEKSPTDVIIDCNGVGYHIHISLHTYAQLPTSENIILHTYFQVKEDSQTLYGFADKVEKEIFKLLISVSFVHFCLIYIKKMQKRHTFLAEYLVNSRNSSNFAASKG